MFGDHRITQGRWVNIQLQRLKASYGGRLKLKLHAAEAGGVLSTLGSAFLAKKLKLHTAEAGGV
jgi:hypothetical protein